MELKGKRILITGGGSGIGAALARRFAAEGAAWQMVADLDPAAAAGVADEIGACPYTVDVGDREQVIAMVRAAEAKGPIDLICSNAGIYGGTVGPDAAPEVWDAAWSVNVMAHIWAAEAALPAMLVRGRGYLLSVASAAGLLAHVSAMPYTVSKHAAVAGAEWLAINYGDRGIGVSCVCPQGVNTPMLAAELSESEGSATLAGGNAMEPESVAESVIRGLREEIFLILPHDEVRRYMANRGNDHERWLGGMRKLRAGLGPGREDGNRASGPLDRK